MSSRTQVNVRLPELTRQELHILCEVFEMSEAQVIMLAIDVLFHRQSVVNDMRINNQRDLLALILNGKATADPTSTPLADKLPANLIDKN